MIGFSGSRFSAEVEFVVCERFRDVPPFVSGV